MPNCVRCLTEKPKNQFYRRSDAKTLYGVCMFCFRTEQAQRRLQFPEYHRIRYLRRYGLTLSQYQEMVKGQDGKCAICFGTQKRALSVDHHHASGKVRQLLCGSCNALLGLAKENKSILEAAIRYLDKHSKSV